MLDLTLKKMIKNVMENKNNLNLRDDLIILRDYLEMHYPRIMVATIAALTYSDLVEPKTKRKRKI
jgi:hypothetical protein